VFLYTKETESFKEKKYHTNKFYNLFHLLHTSFKYKSFFGLRYSSDYFLIMYAVIYTQPLFYARLLYSFLL